MSNLSTVQTTNVSADSQKSPSSWLEWFMLRDSADLINKGAQGELFQLFNLSKDKDKCVQELGGHVETVFLFHQNFGDKRVNLFHHFSSYGGNIYVKDKEFGFIQGVDDKASCFIAPDVNVLSNLPFENAEPVPVINHLAAVTTVEDIENLTNGQQTTFLPCSFIPVPPFLVKLISKVICLKEGDVVQVLLETTKGIKEFDSNHSGDDDYVDKSKQKIRISFNFVVKDKIKALPTMGCNSRPMVKYLKAVEERDLLKKEVQNLTARVNQEGNLESIF